MKAGRSIVAAAIVAAALAAACETQLPSAGPVVVQLRTMSADVCDGVGQSGVVHGNPADPEVVWLGPLVGPGERTDVIWPIGYRAVFDPSLSVIDERGQAVLREGDYVDGGCVTGDAASDPILLAPPFLGFRLECGPFPVHECVRRVSEAARLVNAGGHPVAVLRFVNNRGAYQVFYEDGTTGEGVIVLQ